MLRAFLCVCLFMHCVCTGMDVQASICMRGQEHGAAKLNRMLHWQMMRASQTLHERLGRQQSSARGLRPRR